MKSFEIILERYEKEMSEADKEHWITKKNETYKALLKNMSPADLSVEVKATLYGLRESGYKLAIGSSSKNAKFILGQLGLGEYFDAISDGNNILKQTGSGSVCKSSRIYRRSTKVLSGRRRCRSRA